MAFDPETSSNDFLCGYTQVKPPVDIPARSPSDTLYQLDKFPSNKDREHCQYTGERIGAHADAVVKESSGTEFASDHSEHGNENLLEVEIEEGVEEKGT